jgi:virulence-associated protein VagC
MVLKGEGKILKQGPAKTRFVSIPSGVAGDSAFPFADDERVAITIDGRRVIIEPLEEE